MWALQEYGFRAILSPSCADIFSAKCCQNGVVPVRLLEEEIAELWRRCDAGAAGGKYLLTVDLENQRVDDGAGFSTSFRIDRYRRDRLLRGLDEIAATLLLEDRIAAYEQSRETAIGKGETW